jgi:hypothetical protein
LSITQRLNPFVLASAGPAGLNVRFAHVSLRRNRFAIFRAFLEQRTRTASTQNIRLNPFVFRAFLERVNTGDSSTVKSLNPFDFRAFLERSFDWLFAGAMSQSLCFGFGRPLARA